jgi:hypothetical protein
MSVFASSVVLFTEGYRPLLKPTAYPSCRVQKLLSPGDHTSLSKGENRVMKTPPGLCIGVLLLSGLAIAQQVSQPPYSTGDVQAFRGDQNTLTTAIQAIQQSTGGKVVEIRFAPSDVAQAFNTVVVQSGQAQFMRVAVPSKKVDKISAKVTPDWMLKWQQRAEVKAALDAKVSLSDAIRAAQRSAGAPAIAAGIARSASNPDGSVHAYNVLLLLAGGSVGRLAIDSTNGELLADPQALEGWP